MEKDILEQVEQFDFITPLIILYYKGEDKHSSLFSGFFQLFYHLLFL